MERDEVVATSEAATKGHTTPARAPIGDVILHSPVVPSKIVCVGKNFLGHIREMGHDTPSQPSLFFKPPSSLVGHDQPLLLPAGLAGEEVEHEAELAVVIGKLAKGVRAKDVRNYILGYTCANDVSARNLQRTDSTLVRAKGFDTFCPLGPWIETEVDGVAGLQIECRVNGELRQSANSADVLFGVVDVIEYITTIMTLEPMDVVLMGSPPGTTVLSDGDVVEVCAEGIGCLSNPVSLARV